MNVSGRAFHPVHVSPSYANSGGDLVHGMKRLYR